VSEFPNTMSLLRTCTDTNRWPPEGAGYCPCGKQFQTIYWDAGHQDICPDVECGVEDTKVEWTS
jgi:hypothetical protein